MNEEHKSQDSHANNNFFNKRRRYYRDKKEEVHRRRKRDPPVKENKNLMSAREVKKTKTQQTGKRAEGKRKKISRSYI